MSNNPWQFWIDVGGTFCDCIGRRPDGKLLRAKVLSSEMHGDQEAPLLTIRRILDLPLDAPLPPLEVRLGTTRGTNALLTRRGARTAFITTRGLADVLAIGYQNRPKLFALAIEKPAPLYCAVVEIDERLDAQGNVLRSPSEADVRWQLTELKAQGIESLAVCLLHADRQPLHEELVGRIAAELGFRDVSLSSRVAPLVKIVPRGDTTVVDAYLNPVLRDYVASIGSKLGPGRLRMLTSAGGLVSSESFVGKDSILSGPAGGVVGLARVAAAAGIQHAIGFDMGGTSTDVSRYDGQFEFQYETEKAGVRIVAPMMAIETVAAGGGSICRFDGVKLVVGPESAEADPGPACYGRRGPLAVTDVNLFLGRIVPQRFPFPLDRAAVVERLTNMAGEVTATTGQPMTLEALAEGFVRVAIANMAAAIRSISVAKGVDPRDYTLVAFGGAAGQHACAVAEELGISRVLIHPDAGLLSAYGIGQADVVRHAVAGLDLSLADLSPNDLEATFRRLVDSAKREVLAEGIDASQIHVIQRLDVRYRGTDAALTIPWVSATRNSWAEAHATIRAEFEQDHRHLYGFIMPQRELVLAAARVEVVGHTADPVQPSNSVDRSEPVATGTVSLYCRGRQHNASLFDREQLSPGNVIRGPAILAEASATTVIDPGWEAEVLSGGELLINAVPEVVRLQTPHDAARFQSLTTSATADPILLEIFNNRFAGIAERMGITLRNTALSVNIKERLDFSCAIFTAEGNLVVNAPHIPVHLGAMSHTVRHLIAANPELKPGDMLLTNDPFAGGSHLPDVTVVTPVHDRAGERVLFFTACRAHHAEIGGSEPGSMPPLSQSLAEEGVLLRNFKLLDAGQSRLDELARLLRTAEYPSRAVDDNLADVMAQAAANRQGAAELQDLVADQSLERVTAYMRFIQDAAERKMRAALARLPDGQSKFVDYLELPAAVAVGASTHPTPGDGRLQSVPITATITIGGDQATIDFTGTAPVVPGNLNATPAIVSAAVMYVLRCLIDEEIPLNEGVLAPVRIVLPECLLNPPRHDDPRRCAAVVGGNVETSQRVVDVLLGALGIAAASQGTMNNLLFGDESFGYYESVCGGAGATADRDGADAVHTHMTNTRLTDPEVLERRFPVRLLEFAIRRGSGGAGQHRGGDGIVRRMEFLRRVTVSILSQRRGPHPPYGLHGGEPGRLGRNQLLRTDGSVVDLPGQIRFVAEPGDVLVIETPGGGGWGRQK